MSEKKPTGLEALIDNLDSQGAPVASSVTHTRRRRSPAISAMKGESNQVVSNIESLNKTIEELKAEASQLKSQIASGHESISLTMPVTKQSVIFVKKTIDPSLIDVSEENNRIQKYLDPISCKSLIAEIKKAGQITPCLVRPKNDGSGRYELVDGSRRLFVIKHLGLQIDVLIGDIPQADIRELSSLSNEYNPPSYYERAIQYSNDIQKGTYSNWSQLAAANNISDSQIYRLKSCSELDDIYIRILNMPSDMPITYADQINGFLKKNAESVKLQAEELLKLRKEALANNESFLSVDEILSRLRSSARVKKLISTRRAPVLYKSESGVTVKQSITNKGAVKLEIEDAGEKQLEDIMAFIKKKLSLS